MSRAAPLVAMPPSTLPARQVCEQARLSRDARFDGLFFTAVSSTGIYCRPVCPAPPPKPENVSYYGSAAAAEAAGYRPCLRCRPELSPGDGAWRRGDAVIARALKLIDEGLLVDHPLAALAERVNLGERQLRRLFVERLGAAPIGVHGTRRLLFAKQLLTETDLPITDVAMSAGFGSLRRFNTAFLEAYRMAPRDLRRRPASPGAEALTLRLAYRPPYDFDAMLDFLRGRALPSVERVEAHAYARVVATGTGAGWLRVSQWPGDETALRLELYNIPASALLATVNRIRRMFDLDADPRTIADNLGDSPRLRPLLARAPGLRLPSGWDGFEIAVRAILGQQVSVAAARTLATRLAHRFGQPLATPLAEGLECLFPTPDALAEADLASIGLTRSRADTVRGVARALLDGRVDFRAERTLDDFTARWTALPGIGPWTAHYIAMRALGHPDAFPTDDLVLRQQATGDGSVITGKALAVLAEHWRPWRAYAVIHLWRDAANQRDKPAPSTRNRAAVAGASKPSALPSDATRKSRRTPSGADT
jgi:AraC family transcriptional regulator of adaptative response / DNA-3-methyladenine glycosylase II